MGDVYDLSGEKVERIDGVNESAVEVLERALEMARAGKIQSVAAIGVGYEGWAQARAIEFTSDMAESLPHHVVGPMEVLKHRLLWQANAAEAVEGGED